MRKLDNRQLQFINNYFDPESETYSNAYQSGIAAGFSVEYSEKITYVMPDWLSENVGNNELISAQEIINGILAETRSRFPQVRLKAWELLGKHKKLFTNNLELTSNTKAVVTLSEAEMAKIDATLFEKYSRLTDTEKI